MIHPTNSDPFPSSDFDAWADEYDQDVASETFPFTGYRRALDEIVRLADPQSGMHVLDLGVGTGNLAELFADRGCELWCTDFSTEMIARARAKLPSARFYLHDLRQPFPGELKRRFDRIVSAYVFHHFELPEKADLVWRLVHDHLTPGGRLLIADISFPDEEARETLRRSLGDRWEEELYWVAAETLPALEARGLSVTYTQISNCAGVYCIPRPDPTPGKPAP